MTTTAFLGASGSCDFAQDDGKAVILREVAGSKHGADPAGSRT